MIYLIGCLIAWMIFAILYVVFIAGKCVKDLLDHDKTKPR